MKFLTYFLPLILFFLTSCGTITSTGSRYHQDENTHENRIKKVKAEDTVLVSEEFDITPYRTKIETKDISTQTGNSESSNLNAWYNYDTTNNNSEARIPIEQTAGYRVLVLITDNLEEANNMKTEILIKTNEKPVYITFDPPFYKVKAGDFVNSTEAKEFGFKLNQMGYPESKVIRDTVNIYK
ncbi:MAG: hypothetical protein P4L35_02640 [Ignavibacteriaceae bacterium]|nr:hypothetical protein [Ignavibacteriaceae bacterium]